MNVGQLIAKLTATGDMDAPVEVEMWNPHPDFNPIAAVETDSEGTVYIVARETQ